MDSDDIHLQIKTIMKANLWMGIGLGKVFMLGSMVATMKGNGKEIR